MCPVIHVIFNIRLRRKEKQQRTNTEDHIEKKVHSNVDERRIS
jgi:hypothetical protein